MRKFLYDLARDVALRIAILTAAVGVISIALEAWYRFSLPPIVRGLPGGFLLLGGDPDMERVYQRRVEAAFPIRTAETELLSDLQRQGFTDPWDYNGKKYVKFVHDSFPCRLTWSIVWRADETGGLSQVGGELRRSCL